MENLDIKKIVGCWRIWIDGGWKGSFVSEEDAKNMVNKVIQASKELNLPVTLYLFDMVSTPRII